MRYVLPIAVLAASSSLSTQTFASETSCPPGSWFCSSDVAVVDGPAPVVPAPPVAPASPPTSSPRVVVVERGAGSSPAPVVIVISPEDTRVVEPPPPPKVVDCPPPRVSSPKRFDWVKPGARYQNSQKGWKPEGGFDLYLQRMSFGGVFQHQRLGQQDDATLWGGGGQLRIHAIPRLEVRLGNSVLYGKDFHGFDRSEIGFSVGLVRHLNPTGWFRPYIMSGGVLGGGSVYSTKASALTPTQDRAGMYYASYGALTGQVGVGVDLRLGKKVSVHLDLLAYAHWRFTATKDAPESFDAAGRPTNTFTGALIRTGLTFWPSS